VHADAPSVVRWIPASLQSDTVCLQGEPSSLFAGVRAQLSTFFHRRILPRDRGLVALLQFDVHVERLDRIEAQEASLHSFIVLSVVYGGSCPRLLSALYCMSARWFAVT
jgi:hypothetical protein